jgi:hypothetical protein
MAVEFSEQETSVPMRESTDPTGGKNNLLPFPTRIAQMRDLMAEKTSDGGNDSVDYDDDDDASEYPSENIARHLGEVVSGVNAAMATFATLLDAEGILAKEKVRAALSNAWLDMPENEALGGAGDVFEDVLARLT